MASSELAAKLRAGGGGKVARGNRTRSRKGLARLLAEARAQTSGRKIGATRLHVKLAELRAEIRAARARD